MDKVTNDNTDYLKCESYWVLSYSGKEVNSSTLRYWCEGQLTCDALVFNNSIDDITFQNCQNFTTPPATFCTLKLNDGFEGKNLSGSNLNDNLERLSKMGMQQIALILENQNYFNMKNRGIKFFKILPKMEIFMW